jgi:hypothetical protein
MSGISKKNNACLFQNSHHHFFPVITGRYPPTGYHGDFLIRKGPPFLYYVESCGVEEGFIGFRPAVSPGLWGEPYDFHLTKAPSESKKVDDMLWGPCDVDCSRYPPVVFRLYWSLEYRLQHWCGKSSRLKKVVREFLIPLSIVHTPLSL